MSNQKQSRRDNIVELTEAEIARVSGGKITPVKENRGGNTPKGKAHGVPTYNENPAGHRPPGHN